MINEFSPVGKAVTTFRRKCEKEIIRIVKEYGNALNMSIELPGKTGFDEVPPYQLARIEYANGELSFFLRDIDTDETFTKDISSLSLDELFKIVDSI